MKIWLHRLSLACLLALTVGVVGSRVSAQVASRMWATLASNLATGESTPLLCTASGAGCILQAVISGALANLQTLTVGTGGATATLGGVLTTSTTATCTIADTTETNLWSYSLPGATLDTDGRGLRVTVWGSVATDANAKTIKAYFGATTLQIYTAGTASNQGWKIVGEILRTGATTQIGNFNMNMGSAFLANLNSNPAETLSGAVLVRVTGTNGIATLNEICVRGAIVETVR